LILDIVLNSPNSFIIQPNWKSFSHSITPGTPAKNKAGSSAQSSVQPMTRRNPRLNDLNLPWPSIIATPQLIKCVPDSFIKLSFSSFLISSMNVDQADQ
jgi:hypothetical protein